MSAITASKWRTFSITYCVYAVIYITRKSFSVVKTLIQDDLGLSTYSLGAIDSVFLASYAIFQVCLPSISDTVGVRPVLICSLGFAAIFSLTFSVSYSPLTLIGSWFLEGISHAPVFAVLIKVVSSSFSPSERGRVLGVWTTSQQIGGMFATTLVTFVSTAFGWRAAFSIAGLITAAAAVLVHQTLPETPILQTSEVLYSKNITGVELLSLTSIERNKLSTEIENNDVENNRNNIELTESVQNLGEENNQRGLEKNNNHKGSEDNNQRGFQRDATFDSPTRLSSLPIGSEDPLRRSSTPPGTANNAQPPMKFIDVLKIPNLISCGISYFCVKLVRYALLFWLPYFLITEMGFETASAGYSSLLFDVGGIFGAVASGFIADKLFHGKRLITSAAMCVATSISLVLLAQISMKTPTPTNGDGAFLAKRVVIHPFLNATTDQQLQADSDVGFTLTSENQSHIAEQSINNMSAVIAERASRYLLPRPPEKINRLLMKQNLRLLETPDPDFVRTLILVTLVGFFVAGPDSILGATSASEMCNRSRNTSAQGVTSTATGIVNGLGAFGGVAQGYLTAVISETWGWSALFLFLAAASLVSVAALWECIAEDWNAIAAGDRSNSGRYAPVPTKKDMKTIN